MGTVLDLAGGLGPSTSGAFGNQQAIAVHTDGTLLAVTRDPSVSTATIKVFSSADRGANWTLRATITAPAQVDALACAQFVDGSLGIIFRTSTNLLRYVKVTYGTWAVSAIETPNAGSTVNITAMDIDISDNGVVLVTTIHDSGANRALNLSTRNLSNVWTSTAVGIVLGLLPSNVWAEDVSVTAMGVVSGNLTYVIAVSFARGGDPDGGVKVWIGQITESTGVVFGGAPNHRATVDTGIDTSEMYRRTRRCKIFKTGASEFTILTFMRRADGFAFANLYRYTMTGLTTISQTRNYGLGYSSTESSEISEVAFAMNANKDVYIRERHSSVFPNLQTRAIIWDTATNNPVYLGNVGYPRGFAYQDAPSESWQFSDGPTRNLSQSRMEFLFQPKVRVAGVDRSPVTSISEAAPDVAGPSDIVSLTPAAGSIGNTANPNLTAVIDTDAKYSQSAYRVEFQFATDAGFTTNLITYLQPWSKPQYIDGTDVPGVTRTASDTLPVTYNLTKTTWYYRARLVDLLGNRGAWTTSQTFLVGHAPTLIPTTPTGGGLFNWSAGIRTYSWNFTDPSGTDYQTAYEFILKNVGTGATIFSSGKVTSPDKFITYTIASTTHKDTQLSWQVRGYDSDDTVGPWSELQLFTLTDPTTATIASPTVDQVITTGIPTIQFTPSTGGTPVRTIKEYVVSITKAGETVWAKRVNVAGLASGTPQSVQVDQGYLQNNTGYSVQIQVTDSGNNQGSSSIVPFTVAWVPAATPAGVSVNTSSYNVEDQGYNKVNWNDTARDVDFVSWRVERKDDLIDSLGTVLAQGQWKIIAQVYIPTAAYEYRDYFAPSGYKVTYRVIQNVNRLGQNIDSLPGEAAPVIPVSDGYWLINPNTGSVDLDAFKMSIVTSDDFTNEQEEAEFTVIGRGRIVNKGQRLGPKGQLLVRLRHTGGTTARQKKLRLEAMQEETRQVYLRNPFGDMFKVNVSAMQISRIAGVGLSEFCDVTIPYAEVSE